MSDLLGEEDKEAEEKYRIMLKKGLEWFELNKGANPIFKSYKEIPGALVEDNQDAHDLVEAMYGDNGEPIRADYFKILINHLFYAKKFGWEEYVKELREHT